MIIPEIIIDSENKKVYVENRPPLTQYEFDDSGDFAVYQGCEECGYTGVDIFEYKQGVLMPCKACYNEPSVLHRFNDEDSDFWIDGAKKSKAKWHGGIRGLDEITMLVIHRLARGRGEAGPMYVSKKGLDRHVSWTFTLHHANFSRPITQHLPLNLIGWHAGVRRINKSSIGIEIDAASDHDPHSPYEDEVIYNLIELTNSLYAICKNLIYVRGHHDICPMRRSDPGKLFPWDYYLSRVPLERLK